MRGVFAATPIGSITEEETYHKHFNLNVLGLLLSTQEAVGRLNGKRGVVINISSGVAVTPRALGCLYILPRRPLCDNITRSFALGLGTKARVVSLSPGLTHTEGFKAMEADPSFESAMVARTPLGRTEQARRISPKVAAFLASDEAGLDYG